jgi:hypothetical protein
LQQSTWELEILYADGSLKDENLMRPYEHGGQLKVKIHILFYGDNS